MNTVISVKLKKLLAAILVTIMVTLLFGLCPENIAYAVNNINVNDYGAVPNDGNDDGNAVRAAIDDAAALGQDTNINFSSGIYRISPPATKWEFNTNGNMEGWNMTNQVSGTVLDGNLNLTVSGNDPYITSADHLTMGAESVAQININMKNNTSATQAKIQWITQQDRVWNDTKSMTITITPNDSVSKEYGFYLRGNTNWDNKTIRQIRVHPEEGISSGTVNVNYIKVGSYVNPKWEFTQNGDFQGWTMGNQVTGSVSSDNLNLTYTGTDHYIYSAANPNIKSGLLKIRMKNNTSATTATMQFISSIDSTWGGTKYINFNISANDSDYKEYEVYCNATEWTTSVSQIRLDLCNGASTGTVNVDYMNFVDQNPDQGVYSLRFDYASGLTLNGVITNNEPQTTLLFTDAFSGAFAFNWASDTVFNGLVVDYEQTLFSQGTISAIDTVNKTFDFQPGSGYASILDDPRWIASISTTYGFARNNSNPNLMKTTGGDAVFWTSMTKINSTTWRFRVQDWCAFKLGAPQLEAGDKFVITMRAYRAHGIEFIVNNNVTFNTVNMYAAPEAGFIAWNNLGHITMTNVKLMRKPGSDRWISTNADGVHFQYSRYGTIMENCLIQGCGDDLLSWYVIPTFISQVLSDTRIKVYKGNGYNPQQGDQIEIYNPRDGKLLGRANVTSVETVLTYDPSAICILNLDTTIPGMTNGTSPENADLIFNLSCDHPDGEISGSTFQEGRRIGVWVRMQNGIIENNTFTDLASTALDLEADTGIMLNDGPAGSNNVQILNNTFTNCHYFREGNYQSLTDAVLAIRGWKNGVQLADYPVQKNITVSGNTFNHNQAMNAIYLGSSDTVSITGNNSINGYSGDYVFNGNSTGIRIENSSNVTVDNLRISDPRPGLRAGIKIDDRSKNVIIGTYNAILDSATPSILKTYKASTDFCGTQGPWRYSQWDGTNYSELTYNAGGYWQGTGEYTRVWIDGQHPDYGYDSVRSWHAPTSGTISITAPVSLTSTGGDGVVAKVIKDGGTQLWSQTITSTSPVNPTGVSNIFMNQGSSIEFLVNINANNAYDSTLWNPVVDFIGNPYPAAIVTYKASDGFSGTQGRNQWYYETYDGSVYSSMGTFNPTDNYWQGTQTYTRIANNGQHPSTGEDSVRTWKAPYNATVSIAGNVSLTTGGNGVVVSIVKNTTTLWQTTLSAGGNATPTGVSNISVSAGDVIRFKVNDNGSNAYDSTSWDPVLTVTKQ